MNHKKSNQVPRLQVSASTFETSPSIGSETDSLGGDTTTQVFAPLKTTILLLEDERVSICFIGTSCYSDYYPFSNILRQRVGAILGLKREQVVVFSSHNHSTATLTRANQFAGYLPDESATLRDDQLTDFGRKIVQQAEEEARHLRDNLVAVTVSWAVGHEGRISYNRKGRRADGSTYFIREEDRVLLGQDFNGDIDDHAPVVAFVDHAGRPVCFLVQFTAHPVTSYHPESPVTFGDYAQVACDDLSAAHGNAPVLFAQGCAGDINSKFFLLKAPPEERVKNATTLGHLLGETYIGASRSLAPSRSQDLGASWCHVTLPFTSIPSEHRLRKELGVVEMFLKRVAEGDESALVCLGLNAARSMSPKYRGKLVEPYQRWLHWALRFHAERRLHDVPTGVELMVGAFRIGDIGLVGLPCEPFLGIGRQIREGGVFPLTIPVGYMNDDVGYVPDGPNVGDNDYSSSYYRYTASFLPYRKPCGDLLASSGLRMLKELRRQAHHV